MEDADPTESKSYIFRGDDQYRGQAVGRAFGAEANSAQTQSFADHVLRKESRITSRCTSFTTELKIARRFAKASADRQIAKASLTELRVVEKQGAIRIWNADQVFDAMKIVPGRLAKQAGDVRAAMRKNYEILIEAQIPKQIVLPVNP